MHRGVVSRCLAVVVSFGAVVSVAGSVAATTVPDDTGGTADTKAGGSTAAADPELAAAIAVFEDRMADAGYANLGPAPDAGDDTADTDDADDAGDADEFADCAPEVREVIGSFEDFDDVLAVEGAAQASSDRFGPAAATASSVPTTTDPFSALFGGNEEVAATAQRLDETQIEAVDELIALVGTPAFADCLEQTLADTMDMGDLAVPEMPDFTVPELSDLSIPDLSDLSLPEMPDLSDLSLPEMPDFSELSLPEMPDFTIPDFGDISIPEFSIPEFPDISMPDLSIPELTPEISVTPTADLGVGDASAGFGFTVSMAFVFPIDISVDTVLVRAGDVLVTVSHSRFNVAEESMEVDLAAEAEAIVGSL